MIRKILIASLLLCGIAVAQPPHGGPGPGGPGFEGPRPPHMKGGGEIHGILPPGRWWKDADVVKNIGLNDQQVQKIEQIFQESRLKLVDAHANLQREELKLEPMLEADNPDENSVLSAIDRITSARATVEKANAQMAFAIRRVLTPDQWKKLRALRPHRDHFPQPMRPPQGPQGRMQQHDRRPDAPQPPAPPAFDQAPSPES